MIPSKSKGTKLSLFWLDYKDIQTGVFEVNTFEFSKYHIILLLKISIVQL